MTQIELKQYYSGRLTNEEVIAPGLYEVGDPHLRSLEHYLVGVLGIARFIGEPPPIETVQELAAAVGITIPIPHQDAVPPAVVTPSVTPADITPPAGDVPPATPPIPVPLPTLEALTAQYMEQSFNVLQALASKREVKVEQGSGANGAVKKPDLAAALAADDVAKRTAATPEPPAETP